uniref:Glycosyl hydrolases family 22 (GH22) domain-containing protein n=1 Tax=Falco tinnunculus TaxID=100819 RepID=A0A8C4URP6_FALTI
RKRGWMVTGATALLTVSFSPLSPHGLCMAFYKSTFNTAAQSIKGDGNAHYGIFQFSSQLWHTSDRRSSDNRCRMACRNLLFSNIADDIICAKRIMLNPQGMTAC